MIQEAGLKSVPLVAAYALSPFYPSVPPFA